MSGESKSNRRVFTIPKQKFRQKVPVNYSWIVKLKARDQFGNEEEHEWQIQTRISEYVPSVPALHFKGSVKENNIKYQKFSCKVQIFDVSGAKIKTINLNEGGLQPANCFKFHDIGYCWQYFSNDVDFSFTIGSRDRIKSKPFNRQKIMLDEGILTDMVIKTKERELPCHKFVLAVESEYFKAMFQTEMKEKETNVVDWTGVFKAPVVEELLHFFYTGQKPPKLKNHHFELIEAANLCQLFELKSMCTKSIGETIRWDNAARVLQTAELYELDELKELVIEFLFASSNWERVLATPFYRNLDPVFCKRMLASVISVVDKTFDVKKK